MSSTQPHPESYIKARLAADLGSSTNPHPEGYLEARLAADGDQSNHDVAVYQNGSSNPNYETLGLPISIQSLSLDDVSTNTRVIVSPAGVLSLPSTDDEAVVPFRFPHTPGDVLAVMQSSKKAWFSLDFKDLHCNFYYDAASDDLVLRNLSPAPIQIAPIRNDNEADDENRKFLAPRDICAVSPGPWRIFSAGEELETLTDFLLLRRRFVLEKRIPAAGETGLKRKNIPASEGASKRIHWDTRDDDQSVVLFNTVSQESLSENGEPTAQAQLTVIKIGNPLLSLQSGEMLTVKMLAGPPVDGGSGTELGADFLGAQNTTENYSLLHLRDIASSKGFASVFRASHPIFGHTAVKVIRTRKIPQYSFIPTIARSWQNEERLLRRVQHPSIIKFFGSDARLYSIYMEYLPYPDLAAWRNRPYDHYFAGTIEDAKRILHDMASALDYLCSQRILHNDIKPSNILYERNRGPVLIDFGLASCQGDQLCNGGTPWYVPQEFIDDTQRGFESDVFALGVTLLYLLGKIPLPDVTEARWVIADVFRDLSQATIMQKWLQKIGAIRAELETTGIESIVRDALSPRPRDRISAHKILENIQKYKEDLLA